MIRNFLLISLCLVVMSCGDGEAGAMKTTLSQISNYDDAQTVVDLLDKESIEYFTEMAKAAQNNDERKTRNFCDFYPNPFASRYLIQTLAMIDIGEESAPLTLPNVIAIASLADFGPVGIKNRKNYQFSEVLSSTGRTATTTINYRVVANTYVQSKVVFHKENEVWKINYPSTLSYFEKYLTKLYSQTGGTEREFINGVIEKGGKGVEFQYRQ